MTEEIKARAIKILNDPLCSWTIESATEAINHQEKVIEYWKDNSYCWEAKYRTADAEKRIKVLQAIISILMEREAEQEAIESISSCYGEVPSKLVRKIVVVMANKLRKAGILLSEAFKRAWEFVKFCIAHKYLITKLVI